MTAQMVALKQRAKIIADIVRQGYSERHGEYMANLLCPTPAQKRMRKARESKGRDRNNGK